MLAYVLVAAGPGAVIPGETLDALRRSPPDLPFEPAHTTLWTNPAGTVAFAAWQDANNGYATGVRWHQSKDGGITAFSGIPWRRDRPWEPNRPWAAQLTDHLRAGPLEPQLEEVLGVFSAVVLDRRGAGMVTSDQLGISMLYAGRRDEHHVIGSRANLVADVLAAGSGKDPPRDAVGACWLAFSPYPIGARTGFLGVEVLPYGAAVRVEPGTGIRIERPFALPWEHRNTTSALETASLDELQADVAAAVRAARAVPVSQRIANITGGRDSRLLLAVMLAEGAAHDYEWRTFGRADLPDVVIGRQIAAEFDLHHAVNLRDQEVLRMRAAREEAVRAAGFGDLSHRELSMRLTAGSWFGMRSVAEPSVAGAPLPDRVLLSGICGEMLRTNFPTTRRFRSMRELEFFHRTDLKFGLAGIVREEFETEYDDTIRQSLFDGFADGDVPHDAIDAWYIRHRMRRWFGNGLEADETARAFPLHSHRGVRTAFAIGAQQRHAERLHYELIRRVSKSLAAIPLDQGEWDPVLRGAPSQLPAPKDIKPPEDGQERPARPPRLDPTGPKVAPRVRTVRRDRRARLEAQDVEIMRERLLGDPENPAFDVLDYGSVGARIGRFDELREPARLQLYGALTAAIWLGRDEARPRVPADSMRP